MAIRHKRVVELKRQMSDSALDLVFDGQRPEVTYQYPLTLRKLTRTSIPYIEDSPDLDGSTTAPYDGKPPGFISELDVLSWYRSVESRSKPGTGQDVIVWFGISAVAVLLAVIVWLFA